MPRTADVDLVYYDLLCEEHGREPYAPIPAGHLDKYAGQVPDLLLAIWERHGLTAHGQGEVWFTNPDEYQDLIQAFFGPDRPFIVFSRTSFGRLRAFLDGQIYTIHPQIARAIHSHDAHVFDALICSGLVSPSSAFHEEHQQALTALGPLTAEQMYGSVPPLALGGEGTLADTQIVPLREYLFRVARVATAALRDGWDPLGLRGAAL